MNRPSSALVPIVAVVCSLLQFGCASSPLTTKIANPSLFSGAKSILVRDFSTRDAAVAYEGRADSLGRVMATYVCSKIRERQTNLTVFLDTTGLSTADLIVEGRFTKINEGSEAGRVLLGSGGATVAVTGAIKSRDGATVADFAKDRSSAGGPIGMGGILSGSGKDLINDIMEEIAEDLAEFIVENRK